MYATLNDLVTQYGAAEMAQLLDVDGNISAELLLAALAGNLDDFSAEERAAIAQAQNRTDTIIQQQSVFINGSIGIRYSVPLDIATAKATAVHACCMALSRAAISDDGDHVSEAVINDRNYWRSWCKDVANGKAILPGVAAISHGVADGTENKRRSAPVRSGVDWTHY